jgi:D-sedoheptulose 7-phosphate isomerase
MSTKRLFEERLQGALAAVASLRDQLDVLSLIADALIARLKAGGTLYTAGNGGSAAQALHLAEEFIGRYRSNRPPLRAVCLNADPTAVTCIANDFGFDQVFARQCKALLTERDVLIVLSTSGNSPNIVNALQAARDRGALAIGLLGNDGGRCRALCDHAIVVGHTPASPGSKASPSGQAAAHAKDSAHVQEAHQVALHLLCEAAERWFSRS